MMAESTTGQIKDKYLAGGLVLVLLACYMVLTLRQVDAKFIESAFLIALGALVGLLKQTSSPQTNVTGDSGTTTVVSKGI